jgi:cyclase
MRRLIVLTVLVVAGALTIAIVRAQQDPAAMQIEKVKDGLYIITGGRGLGTQAGGVGGNTTVFITPSGAILIDTKYRGLGNAILDQVKSVTSLPITTIINTHTHGDHTGSNDAFGTNVESIVQENTKANMEKMDAFKGEKAKFLPKKTYKDKMTLLAGKEPIDLYYFGQGHTNGDTFVVFRSLRTMHAGDMFPWKDAPFIDRNNGGSGIEWPKTLDKVLKNVKGVETVIGGHQPVAKWQDLQTFQQYTADLLAQSEAALKAGKSVDDAVAGLNFSKYPGFESTRLKAAVQAIYDELNKK